MPYKVRRFYASILLVLTGLVVNAQAQTQSASPVPLQQVSAPVKTAGEIMMERIARAKAFIAVRNYSAAVFELENIRRETSDSAVNSVVNVLLMNGYLEQGDYKRAQNLLTEFYKSYKANNANAASYYPSIAGQVIKGARNQIERYRGLGLTVSERNLPLEAVNDIEQMRETLELVITQSKELGAVKDKAAVTMPLLEEATTARSIIARDDYDARRWRDEIADSREAIASSRSVILSAVQGEPAQVTEPPVQKTADSQLTGNETVNTTPAVQKTVDSQPVYRPAMENSRPSETAVASNNNPIVPEIKPADKQPVAIRPVRIVGNPSKDETAAKKRGEPNTAATDESGPLEVGSLIGYATKQTPPVYPPQARSMRATGVVKVEVTVDEEGNVAGVQKAVGHSLLQAAARDAIKKWKFRPFIRDGQPVRATGFVTFNFSL
jgi:protein TonB